MPLTQQDLNHILENTASFWQIARNSRFFITGGTGFIGKWLLESFVYASRQLNLNCQMLVLSRSPEKFLKQYPHFQKFKELSFLKADVRHFEFPDRQFDYIIHAAAETVVSPDDTNVLELVDGIVNGTTRTLNFAKQCGAKRFLFVSSGAVYGKPPASLTSIPESYTGAPDLMDQPIAYGQAKRLAETLCCYYHKFHNIQTTIARCFAAIGPYLYLDIHYAIGNFIRDALKGGPIIVKGDGSPVRSYLYAADLAIWLWTILFKGTPATAYNVGSDSPISIAELANKIASLAPKKCNVLIAARPNASATIHKYLPCTDRAKNELNLKCLISLDEAIKRTIEFYQHNNLEMLPLSLQQAVPIKQTELPAYATTDKIPKTAPAEKT